MNYFSFGHNQIIVSFVRLAMALINVQNSLLYAQIDCMQCTNNASDLTMKGHIEQGAFYFIKWQMISLIDVFIKFFGKLFKRNSLG